MEIQNSESTLNRGLQCLKLADTTTLVAPRLALLSKWRQMTASRMQSSHDNNNEMNQGDQVQSNIQELVEALDAVLEPLASERTNVERRINLENLVKEGARLIYMILAMPSTWEFDWKHPENKLRELVVFPALRQTSDEQCRVRSDAQTLTQPQIASMGKTNLQAL